MVDILEPLLFEECLIVLRFPLGGWRQKDRLGVIDPGHGLQGTPRNIYDFNRCSYGSRQRVRVIEMR